ncbi:B-cell receptor CD22-like, partial [Alosa pseudoharengus]|uniref:B-cell receptor CD22-like n=1 Tax=Alosa pseudoharengus TaxID=34774 RepID=UPI003F8C99A1
SEKYRNHVEYLGNKKSSCTLRLKAIRVSHSGEYVFRVTTTEGESYSGLPGVNVSVTALQVFIPPEAVTEGERVTLTCDTTCTLSNDPIFIWYKNGQPVTYKHTTRDNKLHLNPVSSEDAGSYSCSVRGHESLSSTAVFLNVRHRPTHVSVSISPSDGIKEGTSVTLTCSSDANPPVHTYAWYMKSGAESLVRGKGESISFNVTSDTSGLYYCEAQNEVGSQNSNGVAVPPKVLQQGFGMFMAVTSGIIIAVILVLVSAGCKMARKNTTTREDVHSDAHDDTYTALNPKTTLSEYDTLQNVRSVSDRTAQASVYENLQRRETHSTEMELKDLRMKVFIPPEAVTEGERVTLTCDTTCTLSKDPIFIWYKNGQPVIYKHTTRDNKLHLNPVSSEDAGSYSCSVRGHESLSTDVSLKVRHRPTHVSVFISPSDGIKEGTSVTLTCSSDANPPVHTYTWYMKSGSESLVRGTGESINFNVTSDTTGLYYCEAQNEVGSQNSTDAAVPPKGQ